MSFNFDGIFLQQVGHGGNASNVPFERFQSRCVSSLLSSVLGFEQSMCVNVSVLSKIKQHQDYKYVTHTKITCNELQCWKLGIPKLHSGEYVFHISHVIDRNIMKLEMIQIDFVLKCFPPDSKLQSSKVLSCFSYTRFWHIAKYHFKKMFFYFVVQVQGQII